MQSLPSFANEWVLFVKCCCQNRHDLVSQQSRAWWTNLHFFHSVMNNLYLSWVFFTFLSHFGLEQEHVLKQYLNAASTFNFMCALAILEFIQIISFATFVITKDLLMLLDFWQKAARKLLVKLTTGFSKPGINLSLMPLNFLFAFRRRKDEVEIEFTLLLHLRFLLLLHLPSRFKGSFRLNFAEV